MKLSVFLTSVVVIFGLSAVATEMSEEEMKQTMIALSEDCKKEAKASDDDVNLMANKTYPATHEGKCMVLCVQKQFGIIVDNKDGPCFDKTNFMGIIKMGISDADELAKYEKVADDCKDSFKKSGDHCEESINLGKCMEAAADKHGIKPPK